MPLHLKYNKSIWRLWVYTRDNSREDNYCLFSLGAFKHLYVIDAFCFYSSKFLTLSIFDKLLFKSKSATASAGAAAAATTTTTTTTNWPSAVV